MFFQKGASITLTDESVFGYFNPQKRTNIMSHINRIVCPKIKMMSLFTYPGVLMLYVLLSFVDSKQTAPGCVNDD